MVKSIALSLILTIAVAIVGCSSTTSPNGGTVASFQSPGVGSKFVFRADSDSAGTITHIDNFLSETVLASHIAYSGKSDVTQIQNDSDANMTYVSHEANGNLSLYADSGQWQEVPVNTKGDLTSTVYYASNHKDVDKYTYLGTEDITLAGHTFSTVKIYDERHSYTNGVEDASVPDPLTYWFATETGWIVKVSVPPTKDNGMIAGTISLSSYTLK